MINRAARTTCDLALTDDGFAATLKSPFGKTATHSFAWTAIRRIRAVNLDLTVYDEFALAMEFDGGETLQVTESDGGFFDFGQALTEHLPGVEIDWLAVFTRPAFEAIDRVVYEKA